jgi:hypothetical protein
MKTKLWVDDIRKPPDESWIWARTNDEARDILTRWFIEEASLDHDMGHHERDPDDEDSIYLRGDAEDDGVQLVKWMIMNDMVPSYITIHSWNPIGADRMAHLLMPYAASVTVRPYEVQR